MSRARPSRSIAQVEQRTHQRLDVVSVHDLVAGERQRHTSSRSSAAGIHTTSAEAASVTTASPVSSLRPGSPAQPRRRRARRARRRTSTASAAASIVVTSATSSWRSSPPAMSMLVPSPERLAETDPERAELEEVEQPLELVGIRFHAEVVDEDVVDRGVVAQDHQVEVLARPCLVLDQRRLQLGRLLVDVGEDPVEAAVLVDQLGRRLLPHSRHAGQVVGVVAAQRRVLRVEGGRDAGLLLDARLVVEGVVADAAPVVEHPDVRVAHELVAVAVTGDDDHVVALADEQVDGRGDQVVGFPAGAVDRWIPIASSTSRTSPICWRRMSGAALALRLVLGLGLVTERRLGPVEGDEHAVGLLVLQHVDQHRREAEHGVGDLPAGGRHVGRQREERPVGQRVAVDEEVGAHQVGRATRRRVAASRRGCGRRRRACASARSSPCAG